jgi:rhodanese-related sulfurtransferase
MSFFAAAIRRLPNRIPLGGILIVFSALVAGSAAPPAEPQESRVTEFQVTKLNMSHLPNAMRVHPKVISGGLPNGDDGFRELASLNVKTVISVDGTKPAVSLARKYGIRYVHLPHSYDGIPARRIAELAKSVRDLEGPIYIHCHHGKHRSPAAAAAACVAAGFIPSIHAKSVLVTGGTSESYRGLFQSVETASRIDDVTLNQLVVEFPEVADVPQMAESMVQIEGIHDRLKVLTEARWNAMDIESRAEVVHDALLLREQFAELLRMPDVLSGPDDRKQGFEDARVDSENLETQLRSLNLRAATAASFSDTSRTLKRITTGCRVCHEEFRDIPLNEKPFGTPERQ